MKYKQWMRLKTRENVISNDKTFLSFIYASFILSFKMKCFLSLVFFFLSYNLF